ncbi:MAG TPA: hypothetical protein VIJ19_05465 [Opitutaceae bacterium]
MRNEEAKFILSAYRPGGGDSGNPAFTDALRMATDDPVLGAWFAQSRAHDGAVAAKLVQIQPPAGLREAILAGVRVTDTRKAAGLGWGWISGIAAAAALAIGILSFRAPAHPETATTALGGFAIDDMLNAKHGGRGEPATALVAQLQTENSKMPGADQIDFEKLRDTGCRTLNFAGHDLLEVCFARDGAMFHIYITRRDGPLGDSVAGGPSFVTESGGAAAVWSDARFDYAVASTAGVAALRRLL